MTEKVYPVENWPAAHFVAEELEARGVSITAYLRLIGMDEKRWMDLVNGQKSMLLSEVQRIAGSLNVQPEFIANLNLRYGQWKRMQR